MSPTQPPPSPIDDEIDLGRLFALLLDHKGLIIAITVLAALAGTAYAILATPVYQGDALVQVERRSTLSPLGDLSTLLGEGMEVGTAAEVQILQSRLVLGQVVERIGLDTVVVPRALPVLGDFILRRGIERPPFMAGRPWVWGGEYVTLGRLEVPDELVGEPLSLVVGYEDQFHLYLAGQELGQGRVGQLALFLDGALQLRVAELAAEAGAEFILVKRSRAEAIRHLASRLSVNEVGGGRAGSTGILRLTKTGSSREDIRRALDTVAETFLTQNVERQSAQAEKSLAFLQEQAPELRAHLAAAEDLLNQYRVGMDSIDLSSEAQAVIQQFIEIERHLSELEFQEAELAQRFTPQHPSYQALLRQKNHLLGERARLNTRVNELPAAQQEVIRLTRDVEVTQAIYVNVLNKMQEMEVARAGTVGNVRIIDTAVVGADPIQPKKALVVALATILGGMLGVGTVLVRGFLRRGVESPVEIEQAGLPVYATVPFSAAQGKLVKRVKRKNQRHGQEVITAVLAERAPMDTAIEALRGLRTSLHFAILESGDNRLAITGPSPGIGKSFVTINLGAVCAQAGQKVLLIDADMRKGHIHQAFKGQGENGLSELLAGRIARLEQIVRPTGQPGLSYIARGTAPPNPSELLMSAGFGALLAEAGAHYDLVLLDTPPILAVTDAAIVGKQCGTTLLVARYQLNPLKELLIAGRRLETAGVKVKGVILNGMEHQTAGSYGYYNYAYK